MFSPEPLYRISHWLYRRRLRRMAEVVSRLNYGLTGCLIPAQVQIGLRPRFPDFGSGVVINLATVIGDDFMILPHAVIGQNVRPGREVVPANIVIGDGVVIGAGAKIIATGLLEIGDGAAVGANAVVLRSVPPRMLAIGIPARLTPIKEPQGQEVGVA